MTINYFTCNAYQIIIYLFQKISKHYFIIISKNTSSL